MRARKIRWIGYLGILCIMFIVPGGYAQAQDQPPPPVNLRIKNQGDALLEIFGRYSHTRSDTFLVTHRLETNYREAAGYLISRPWIIIYTIMDDTTLMGYAVVSEEVGKFYPITYLVGVNPDLNVKGVRVLVYRESHGGDIRRERFLHQYRGKSLGDPIRSQRDIINISGATLSVNALNRGVKKVLFLLDAHVKGTL